MKKTSLIFALAIAFASCNSKTSDTQTSDSTALSNADTVATASTHVDGETICFEEKFNKDITTVKLVIHGDIVTGTMLWQPWEKDGANGTLKGKKSGDIITADYDYMIEGSQQLEEKLFKLEGDKLMIKTGELEEKNGKLILKDPSKAKYLQTLKKVKCE